MSLFEDAMAIAVQLPTGERERLARALGLSVHSKGPGKTLPLNQFVAQPDPNAAAAWRRAETGHAVVPTGASAGSGTPAAEIAAGPQAIAGMWPDLPLITAGALSGVPLVDGLAAHTPVIVHTSVCQGLAAGHAAAIGFWRAMQVEARLATATYLALLGEAADENQMHRLQRFVQPFAVLSLGPMASSRAVELMLAHGLSDGLGALDALIAATALAHEIPLVTANPAPFAGIAGLVVVRPY
jgi:predicted nucleic acid-binding protein